MTDSVLAISSREQSIALGKVRYFTGAPCRNGHISERRVSDKVCIACERAKERRYLTTAKGRAALWRKNNSDLARTRRLRWTKTPQGRVACNRNNKTAKGRAARQRFFKTEKGKACAIREAHKRKVRKLGLKCVPYGHSERVVRFALFDNRCAYCGMDAPLAEDHFIPLKLNGGHFIENIVPACKSCNSRKNASHPERWYKAQSFFSAERWNLILKYTQLEIAA